MSKKAPAMAVTIKVKGKKNTWERWLEIVEEDIKKELWREQAEKHDRAPMQVTANLCLQRKYDVPLTSGQKWMMMMS